MSGHPHFEIAAGKDSKFYWHLKVASGEVILAGRGFPTKAETIHAIASVMRFGVHDQWYVRRESINGAYFFQVKSPSGRLLGWSEMHQSKAARESAIVRVKAACTTCNVIDTAL